MAKTNFIKKFFELLLISFIKIYQLFLSKLLHQNNCRFIPSCSSYAIEAIEKKGLIKGICFAIYRILRCNPFNKNFGHDPVEKLKKNDIKKTISKKIE
jgi:putative membrane protein insertion efficiency factor